MTEELLTKGNITTIATWVAILITGLLTYLGYELDYTILIPGLSFVITFCIAVYSSKHPNTLAFLGNYADGVTINVDKEELSDALALALASLSENQDIETEVDEDGD